MDSRKLIIGFGCKRLRGKDTAANILNDLMWDRSYTVRKDAFARTLKDVCELVFGFTDRQLNDQTLKEVKDEFWGFTPRWALQTVGTEAFRKQIQNDIWIKVLQRRFEALHHSVIVTDIRFENEAIAIKEWGGFIVRVDRDIPFDNNKDQHASETSLDHFDDWDYIIDNNGTLNELLRKVRDVLDDIERKKGIDARN